MTIIKLLSLITLLSNLAQAHLLQVYLAAEAKAENAVEIKDFGLKIKNLLVFEDKLIEFLYIADDSQTLGYNYDLIVKFTKLGQEEFQSLLDNVEQNSSHIFFIFNKIVCVPMEVKKGQRSGNMIRIPMRLSKKYLDSVLEVNENQMKAKSKKVPAL